ncbi:CaiB/BaiF CoA transferase family protein [Halomarina halobia]|uniref:CaiB/BaiF CoA transferase family protein n=1 Tax=Halomarina halobia TaxID=3033386 RepID=A0ABD6AE12_9EURY|nr:CoA transferase [Halomarina sp. PSR21]
MPAESSGPLSGLRVLDLSTMISGGFATTVLADFGADVIKVEHPEYLDPIRAWGPFYEGASLWWKSLSRNNRCVTLNLSTDDGRELALELAADVDIVFENFRPGTIERWGLGYEDFVTVNEDIIMVRLSGYGQTGPRSQDRGFGSIAEGLSGFAHVNGFPDSEPLLPPMPLADLTAAQSAVHGAMFALFEREIGPEGEGSGEGQVVDVSLYEPLFRLFVGDVEAYDKLDYVRDRVGNRSTTTAPRNLYEAADGYVTLSASAQSIFENVMDAIGRDDLVDDPRFETNEKRVEHVRELDAVIEEWTRRRPREEIIRTMTEYGAIVGPVYDITDIFDDEQYAARDDVVEVEDPEVGDLKTPNTFPKLSRTPGKVRHAGPSPGAHNEAVYVGELGLGRERYEQLEDEGVI